jgi:hypothetical protein
LFEEQGKGTNFGLSREFDNYPESPLWEKLLLLHHSALKVLMSGIFKNIVAIEDGFFLGCQRATLLDPISKINSNGPLIRNHWQEPDELTGSSLCTITGFTGWFYTTDTICH